MAKPFPNLCVFLKISFFLLIKIFVSMKDELLLWKGRRLMGKVLKYAPVDLPSHAARLKPFATFRIESTPISGKSGMQNRLAK